ncbi:MAG: tetratricopeptide repeat protein [Candidatus Wallbacteria bacterium]|nr:tetratricopeptide repeat protein [Candidatus Wallbacteria bacterium]
MLGFLCGLLILEFFFQAAGLVVIFQRPSTGSSGTSELQILCLGDSYTYGLGVKKGEDYPSLLQEYLREKDRTAKYRVINGGLGGINSRVLLNNLPKNLVLYKPDIVAVQVGGQNRMNFTGYSPRDNRLNSFLLFVTRYSRVLRLCRMLGHNIADSGIDLKLAIWRGLEEGIHFAVRLKTVRPEDFKTDPQKISCSIDYFRLTGEVWNLIRKKDLNGAGTYLKSKALTEMETYAQGLLYLVSGNFTQADLVFKEGLRKFPGSCSLAVGQGFAAMEAVHLYKAFNYFMNGLSLDPNDTGAMFGLGFTYFLTGNQELAELWIRKSLELDPANSWKDYFLGNLYLLKKDSVQAEKCFRDGITARPEMPENYTSLAEICQQTGRLSEAGLYYEKALELGIFFRSEGSEVNYRLSRIRMEQDPLKNKEEGKKLLLRAIQLDPSNNRALFDLGWFYAGIKDYKQALAYFEQGKNYEAAAWTRKILSNRFNSEIAADWLAGDLRDIVRICSRAGIKLYFVNYPEMDVLPMKKVSEEQGISMIDLTYEFGKLWQKGEPRENYFLADRHCNALGNRETARLIGERILTDLKK